MVVRGRAALVGLVRVVPLPVDRAKMGQVKMAPGRTDHDKVTAIPAGREINSRGMARAVLARETAGHPVAARPDLVDREVPAPWEDRVQWEAALTWIH